MVQRSRRVATDLRRMWVRQQNTASAVGLVVRPHESAASKPTLAGSAFVLGDEMSETTYSMKGRIRYARLADGFVDDALDVVDGLGTAEVQFRDTACRSLAVRVFPYTVKRGAVRQLAVSSSGRNVSYLWCFIDGRNGAKRCRWAIARVDRLPVSYAAAVVAAEAIRNYMRGAPWPADYKMPRGITARPVTGLDLIEAKISTKTVANIAREQLSARQYPKMSAMVGQLQSEVSDKDKRIAALEAQLAAARAGTYAERRAWADKYEVATKRAILHGLCLAGYPAKTSDDVDREEGVDFTMPAMRFSWRNHKEAKRRKHGLDNVTIRTTGQVSELDKILAGKIDVGMYSHAMTDTGNALYAWTLVDWSVFRANHGAAVAADCGGFVSYKISDFPKGFVIARYSSGAKVNGVAHAEVP